MEINIKHVVKRALTFGDIETTDLFVFEGRVYIKWGTTTAVCINTENPAPRGFEIQREVKRVVSLEVTVQDA